MEADDVNDHEISEVIPIQYSIKRARHDHTTSDEIGWSSGIDQVAHAPLVQPTWSFEPHPESSLSLHPEDQDGQSVNATYPDPAWNGGFGLSQEETNQLLASLQESVPEMGRLFDGSIGTFGQ